MGFKILSKVEAPGKSSAYEDSLAIVSHDNDLFVGVFDGRRAWKEGGDAERMVAEHNVQSTGQAAALAASEKMRRICGVFEEPWAFAYEINYWWRMTLQYYRYDFKKPEGLPGCAATIVRFLEKKRAISFANILDTKIILFNEKAEFFIPTIDHMESWDRIVLRIAVNNGKALGVSPRAALWEVDYAKHPSLRDPKAVDNEHRRLENVSYEAGLGVLNGMSSAVHFIQTGTFPMGRFQYALICTDGLSFPPTLEESPPWKEMVQFLLTNNLDLELLVKEIRRREDDDREFIKYPRFAYNRDATGVLIEIS